MTIQGKKLAAYPITEDIEYREKTDSAKLNKILNSMEESVLRALIRGSEFKEAMDKLYMAVSKSYLAMSNKPTITSRPDKTIFATPHNNITTPVSGEIFNLNIDKTFGQLTLASENISYKTPRVDTDGDGILDKVSPLVKILVDGEERDEDDDCYNALDKNASSFWIEEASVGEHEIEIQFPPAVESKFNYIKAIPFPLYGMEISGVYYQDTQSSDVELSPSNPVDYFPTSEPIKIYTTPIEYNGTIKFKVNVLDNIGVMGFSAIDLASTNSFRSHEQEVYVRFDGLGDLESIKVDSLELDYYIDNYKPTDEPPIADISLVTTTDDTANFIKIDNKDIRKTQEINQNLTGISEGKIWLKFTIKERNKSTPVFRGAKLKYS